MKTDRLILRRWQAQDLEPFAALNSDPEVMRFFPGLQDREQSAALIERTEQSFSQNGFGLWAVEEQSSGEFIGFVGLASPKFEAHFTPCVEVGWRLAKKFWGKGYAQEAARAALQDGFERVGLKEIVSFTATLNLPSIKVMERLQMTRDPAEDFAHPNLAADSPLSRHVLYRLQRPA
ncbi:MAG: GNAT family N-acetyltransferase [Cyanobacteria bacterium SZAS LIN-3]|nr:GNAT family N-acetyltransferase [Cyanobacteria bacterium SZAS LIN-3]MBS2005642.1 GNAT family N-acetyltransferase [Cyanobacteria bacterium SZAS TMP-1]